MAAQLFDIGVLPRTTFLQYEQHVQGSGERPRYTGIHSILDAFSARYSFS